MSRLTILDVPIDPITSREALQMITGFFRSEGQFHIATPNPEMLVEAQRNDAFRDILNRTNLNIPDGTGLLWAAKKLDMHIPERVTGTDMLPMLCAAARGEPIFLLGAAEGVAEKTAEKLQQAMPFLKIAGTYAGSPREEDEADVLARINETKPTLLFVAYGAPAQDMWIARNLPKMPTVKVAMSVGGAFDFIVGKQKRAPGIFRTLGLEWLWRFIMQPTRAKRIYNAVIAFPRLIRKEGTHT